MLSYRFSLSTTVWSVLSEIYWQTRIHENIVNMRKAQKNSPSYLALVRGRVRGIHTFLHVLPRYAKVHEVVERNQKPGAKNWTNEQKGILYPSFNN